MDLPGWAAAKKLTDSPPGPLKPAPPGVAVFWGASATRDEEMVALGAPAIEVAICPIGPHPRGPWPATQNSIGPVLVPRIHKGNKIPS
eukprot:7631104-Pyramimonas_sp.AAC.1